MLPEQAAHHVGGAAGRRWHDDAHGFGRLPVGMCETGQGGETRRTGEKRAAADFDGHERFNPLLNFLGSLRQAPDGASARHAHRVCASYLPPKILNT